MIILVIILLLRIILNITQRVGLDLAGKRLHVVGLALAHIQTACPPHDGVQLWLVLLLMIPEPLIIFDLALPEDLAAADLAFVDLTGLVHESLALEHALRDLFVLAIVLCLAIFAWMVSFSIEDFLLALHKAFFCVAGDLVGIADIGFVEHFGGRRVFLESYLENIVEFLKLRFGES